ncbi:hypothetical protein [Streptomyces sp. NPDC059063]|uniref:hypothetical protein n=1 Tax=unclassified Streptomyces TaxID=2593676 RepID=UPI0036A2DB82
MGEQRKVSRVTRERNEAKRFWICVGVADFALFILVVSITGFPVTGIFSVSGYAARYRSDRIQRENALRAEKALKAAILIGLSAAAAVEVKKRIDRRRNPDEDD